ncbi:MAG: hypothetical protein QOH97_2878 [Actinoplanes sp.]|jgi:hypothetical protein|nr:hypothetical protein [Actinoplanes sp.]
MTSVRALIPAARIDSVKEASANFETVGFATKVPRPRMPTMRLASMRTPLANS